MIQRLGIAAALTAITLLTYFQFPGHTYLQQDTQIYVPILEHLHDGSVLSQDLLVQRPHVAFTLYDEVALGIRSLTGASFHSILTTLQIITRGLGCWGIYLIALSLLSDWVQALFVTALFSLGAAVDGPAVLTVEYEPSPRAFAIPLVFLAIGLVMRGKPVWASLAAACAFVLHPPSAIAFLFVLLISERKWEVWIPFLAAIAVLLVAAIFQPGIRESQLFFSRVTPELERLQRMRASYNWVSLWWSKQALKYLVLIAVVLMGYWRIRKHAVYLVGLPAIGLLSVPVSWLLLEVSKWALMPQIQPARTLLFVVAMAMLLGGVCGCLAAREHRWLEASLWFAAAYAPPLVWSNWWFCAALASVAAFAVPRRWALPAVAAAGFFVVPFLAGIHNYPVLHTPELAALSGWAERSTPKDAIFVFPDFAKRLEPGIFRSEGLRAVYVDWKGGGQVNFLPELADEWWARWQDVMLKPVDPDHYRDLGVSYFVVAPEHKIAGRTPVYSNLRFVVYGAGPNDD